MGMDMGTQNLKKYWITRKGKIYYTNLVNKLNSRDCQDYLFVHYRERKLIVVKLAIHYQN